MRRLKAPDGAFSDTAYYHCVSRVVNRDFVFGPVEKQAFVRFLRMYERFCGLRVVTFCVMSNHFHLLVGVPKKPEVMPSNAQLLQIVRESLGDLEARRLEDDLELVARADAAAASVALAQAAVCDRYLRRMWDISLFMKTLKQRFTQWFNKVHQRKGTLWEDRFKSVLVESAGEPLRAMAAYIDLNPVRAGLVEDPKDYRWSGYGEAMGGSQRARRGLAKVTGKPVDGWEKAGGAEAYRCLLFSSGVEIRDAQNVNVVEHGVSAEEARAVLQQKGRLSKAERVRLRVRYFSESLVLGGKAFVEAVYEANRGRYSPKRKQGARPIQEMTGWYALRRLRRS